MKLAPRESNSEDIPRLVDMAKQVYGDRFRDEEGTKVFIRGLLSKPNALLLVSHNGFGCAIVEHPFWEEHPVAYQLFLGALPNGKREGLKIAHGLMVWAKKKGAKKFVFSSDMGRNFKALPMYLKLPFEVQDLVVVKL